MTRIHQEAEEVVLKKQHVKLDVQVLVNNLRAFSFQVSIQNFRSVHLECETAAFVSVWQVIVSSKVNLQVAPLPPATWMQHRNSMVQT